MTRIIVGVLIGFGSGFAMTNGPKGAKGERRMELGNFSVSLLVKDVAASRAFYEKLGFRQFGDMASKNMVILQNKTATIGLFAGGIKKNTLTFNPGWDRSAKTLAKFDDVREIQKQLKSKGVELTMEADPASTGPAFVILTDPDGNPVFIDQHVPKPKK